MVLDIAFSLMGVFALVALSAFLTGSQAALAGASKPRLQRLAEEGSWPAERCMKLIADREKLTGSLLVGNTFVIVLATALATAVSLSIFASGAVLIAALLMTAAIVFAAEVLPRMIAIRHADRVALPVSAPIRPFVALFAPVAAMARWLASLLLLRFGERSDRGVPIFTQPEEIRSAIEQQHQGGTVEREHRAMLGGVLDLAELKVGDVMVHRTNMEMLDGSGSAEEIVDRVLDSTHTRFPIWRSDPENMVGVLHLKDLVRELMERGGSIEDLDVMALASEPWYVPDTTTLEEQLAAFRERRERLAFVVDEYGVLQGLVTLEDILQVVFGKIEEDIDHSTADGIRPQADGSFNVDGWLPIRELNRERNWSLPDQAANTIAGLIINESRVIPEVGQVFSFYGFKFEILRRQRNQITALRIVPPPPTLEERDDTG